MSIIFEVFTHTAFKQKEVFVMEHQEVNTSIGCGVTECKYNRAGDYCTLRKIHVGNTCSCDAESCTCCDSFERK
jgi:hypothetical protein